MRNEWVIQTIGEKILLGFQGNKKFVETSINFAYNYLVIPSEARVQTLGCDQFVFISTTLTKLREGLLMEGRCLIRRALIQKHHADTDPEENYSLDKFSEEIRLGAESHYEDVMKSIRNDVFYHFEMAESFLTVYKEPQIC